ncbi:MAG TPA: hypothetical protein VJS92_18355 [Candidatus Polarisedimenticolaceae bacterium]|nr:hypothetical protein [Candidatus Polarisedimenticolaceae bacterium]
MIRRVALAAALGVICTLARAQNANQCDVAGEAPDVIVGDIDGIFRYGASGGITAYSIGTWSCNVGTCWLNWFSETNQHPVIGQNMFRLKDGRFEQIGQSWLKHGFFALSDELCSTDCHETNGEHLGVNCADPYEAGLNGYQPGLGPKFEVDASQGAFLYPFTGLGQAGNAIFKRLQVHDADLAPALNAGAVYFVEGQYVTADDAQANNDDNNASHREVAISEPVIGSYAATLVGPTQITEPAIHAWQVRDPGVMETPVDVPADGRFIVAARATDLGGGTWHYEYAVHNLNSSRSAQSFSVPLPGGTHVTNVGFHDVDYHSGEPFDGTDWTATVGATAVTWSTASFAVEPNANALRWGTLYNFRFDADVMPGTDVVTLGLFRPGTPGSATFSTLAPSRCDVDGVCAPGETCTNCAVDCVHESVCCGDGVCQRAENGCVCRRDCGPPDAFETSCSNGEDDDCDGATDCPDLDCCLADDCFAPDGDGDGFGGCDCDDGDAQVWSTPGEARDLLFGDAATLSWDAPSDLGGQAVQYDVLRSAAASNFTAAAICLAAGLPAPTVQDAALPAAGGEFCYLVRATNTCPAAAGHGPLGTKSDTTPRSGRTCP